jgi:DNA-binding MarR family transcriptional regulator
MKATAGRLSGLLGYQVRRAQVRAFQSFAQAAGGMGLTPMLFGVLVVIDERPGVSQAEIADALGADPSTMVRMLDQLEKRAWVRREPSPVDRRSTLPVLTEAGRSILVEALPLVIESDRRIAAALTSAERETLLDLLRRL